MGLWPARARSGAWLGLLAALVAAAAIAVVILGRATTTASPALAWADEFDGAAGSPPDPERWSFEVGGDGWGNQQLEYNNDRNASLDGRGNLVIVVQPTSAGDESACWYGPCRFVSSRLSTEGLFAQQYGRVEVRVALPAGDATWSALWMLGADRPSVGWPLSGEIDIVEHVGRWGDEVAGGVHGPGYAGESGLVRRTPVAESTEFHVYAVDWSADQIVWTVDGEEWHRFDRSSTGPGHEWVFDKPFYLIVNLAMGGSLGREPTAADERAHGLVVDYVRVYEAP